MNVPDKVLELESRANDLYSNIKPFAQVGSKVEKRSPLCERVKEVLTKFAKLQQISPEIINNNIQKYSAYLEDKEDTLKMIFLYEAFMKLTGRHYFYFRKWTGIISSQRLS